MKIHTNIFKILKLIYNIDKKMILYEVICSFVENIEKVLRILLPAVVIRLITEETLNISLIITLIIISIISVFGLISKILASLLSPYSFKISNSIDGKIREKLFKLDYEYSESEEHLAKYNLVRSTFYQFLDVDYLVINELFGSIIVFVVMSVIIAEVNWVIYICVLISSVLIYKIGNQSAKEIKIYNAVSYIKSQYEEINVKLARADETIEKYKFSVNVKKIVISFLQNISIYVYAIYKFLSESLQIGSFYIFVSAGTEFVNSVITIINTVNEIKLVDVYYNDYEEYMNIAEKMYSHKDSVNHITNIETIEFQNVSFVYKNTDKYAVHNINCKFEKSNKIALIGDNGAGKTTFIKLLLRLYDPMEGLILVNGKDVKSYDYSEYLEAISAVFQDSKLTGYSLLENIIIDREYNKTKLYKVREAAGILERIDKLKNGFDSIVSKDLSDEGIQFSDGEEQKIAISRALYKSMDNVVLDEPTSAMDAISEKSVFEKMNQFSENGILIYITHRLSNVAFAIRFSYLIRVK